MNTPRVSVIVMIYENLEKVYQTLDSILMQDYPNLELIVSDDSTNPLPKGEIENYLAKNNVIYKVRESENNLGTVAHCNRAASEASGEFIKFLASGDGFIKSNSLSEMVCFAIKNRGCPVITSVSQVCNDDFTKTYYNFPSQRRAKILNSLPPRQLFSILVFSNIISAVGALFHREFFEKYNGFDEQYRLLEDLPTWLRLTRDGLVIPCSPVATVYYSVGGVSSQNGTAFESNGLRPDMILCYEREILPHLKEVPYLYQRFAQYQYEKLKGFDKFTHCEKALFWVKYFPFEIYRRGKSLIKGILTTIKGGK